MSEERTKILQVIRALLRPVARLCVRYSISVRDLLEMAKRELIEAAGEERRRAGHKVNVSRISAMTGLQRKDIMRIQETDIEEAPPATTITSRVIGQWEQDPQFQAKNGKPKVLSLEGEQNEFRDLVRLISKDINSGTVAAELERIGVARREKDGLKLLRSTQKITDDWVAGYQLLAADLNDLSRTVQENLAANAPIRNLHARTEFDNIYQTDLPKVKQWLLEEGSRFHEKVRNYLAEHDQDIHPDREDKAGAKVVLGTFSYVNVEEGERDGT